MKAAFLMCVLSLAQTPEAEDPVSVVKEAAAAYRAKDYAGAGALFRRAYDLTKLPTQLRNAAKAYQDGELWTEALESWGAFRDLKDVTPADIAEANAQIALIKERRSADEARAQAEAARVEAVAAKKAQAEAEARAEAVAAASKPPPPPPAAPPLVVQPPPPPPPYGAYVTTGLGIATAIAAGVFYLHANGRIGTLDDQLAMKNGAGEITGIARSDAIAELDGINAERNAAVILAGVGLVTTATGIVWWALAGDEAEPPPPGGVRF